jgi:two-component system, NtrC family, nitrogen regulation sensor histidine kinase NtrY
VLVVAALVLARVSRMVGPAQQIGRIAAAPAAVGGLCAGGADPHGLVAVFAVLTVNVGLRAGFPTGCAVVGSPRFPPRKPMRRAPRDLTEDAVALAAYLNVAKQSSFFLQDDQLRPVLTKVRPLIQRGLREAYLIDGRRRFTTRGERSYLFDFERPDARGDRARASGRDGDDQDWANNEFRALVHLDAFADRFLYVSASGRLDPVAAG